MVAITALLRGADAELPVVVEGSLREVLRADEHLLVGPAGVGDDRLRVDVERRCRCRRRAGRARPRLTSWLNAESHSLSAVMTTFTSTPRRAAATSAEVMVGSSISSFSTDSVCLAPLITARIDDCELVGDQTRSAPSGGVIDRCAKSALNVVTIACDVGRPGVDDREVAGARVVLAHHVQRHDHRRLAVHRERLLVVRHAGVGPGHVDAVRGQEVIGGGVARLLQVLVEDHPDVDAALGVRGQVVLGRRVAQFVHRQVDRRLGAGDELVDRPDPGRGLDQNPERPRAAAGRRGRWVSRRPVTSSSQCCDFDFDRPRFAVAFAVGPA